MVYCSVLNCKNGNYNRKNLGYFTFPTFDRERLDIWIHFCRRNDRFFRRNSRKARVGKENSLRICSAHFRPELYKISLNGRYKLKENANPEIFPSITTDERQKHIRTSRKRSFPKDGDSDSVLISPKVCRLPISHESNQTQTTSHSATNPTSNTQSTCNPLVDHSYCSHSQNDDVPLPLGQATAASQTDIALEDLCEREDEINKLKTENVELLKKYSSKASLKRDLFVEDVMKSDEYVKFYTGIPAQATLQMLFDTHQPEAKKLKYWDTNKGKTMYYEQNDKKKPGPKRTLSLMQEFVLTLVKLRLGLTGKQLADIFSISESQVSRIFTTWVCFLALSLKETLLCWPSKELVRRKLPRTFNKYPNTRVILDCTEMFVEKPTSPYAQKATWSEYKQHNTIKTLVGITPNGYFSFISKFWSGSTSDRKITQESGIIDLLEEGDAVMADKGFNIRDILTKKKVFLNIPPFAKKGKQLSNVAAKSTRQIAQVRIHVERAIERLKDFKVFQGNIPLTLLPLTDQMLIVCAALCNLQKPLA